MQEAGEIPARSRRCDRFGTYSETEVRPAFSASKLDGTRNPKEPIMTDIANTIAALPPRAIPLGELLPWAIFGGLLMLVAIYFVGGEQGAVSIFSGMYVHEFVHDGRHLLGFPCH
jgi:hypothetical protein